MINHKDETNLDPNWIVWMTLWITSFSSQLRNWTWQFLKTDWDQMWKLSGNCWKDWGQMWNLIGNYENDWGQMQNSIIVLGIWNLQVILMEFFRQVKWLDNQNTKKTIWLWTWTMLKVRITHKRA